MEHNKINNLLLSEDNESEVSKANRVNEISEQLSKFVTREDVKVKRLSNTYNANNIRDKRNRPLILKNNAPFVSCITRINGELIEDADDLDIVMPIYNLLEYSKNYRKTIGSLYNYYRDELSDDADDNNFDNINVVNSEAFNYKNKIIGNMYNVNADDDGYDVNKKWYARNRISYTIKIFR